MRRILALVISTVLVLTPARAAVRPEHVVAFVFDWDDNVFEMPTRIMLFHKRTGAQRGVSTDAFALMRGDIGRAGTPWADYELRPAPPTGTDSGSMRFFGDASPGGAHQFAADIALAMRTPRWQGPVWNDFVAATRRESTARHTYFITARLHAPATIHAAVDGLRRRGLIRFTPPLDNVWPVAQADFANRFQRVFGVPPPAGDTASPSARKAAVMEQILDSVERVPLPAGAPLVSTPDGRGRGAYHLWGFSDDDLGNVTKAVEVLQKGVDAGRWPHVKITVFYTGTNRTDVRPHAVTLVPHQPPRHFHDGPAEWKQLLAARDRAPAIH